MTLDRRSLAARIDALDYSGFSVLPEHLDANGHMNVGYYGVVFDKALELPWAALGLYSEEILAAGRSTFALESHLTFQRELRLGEPLDFAFRVLDYDAKRIHYFMAMLHREHRWVAATCEQISICVDMGTRRSTAWPEDALERIAALHAVHAERPRPIEIGRTVGIRRKAQKR